MADDVIVHEPFVAHDPFITPPEPPPVTPPEPPLVTKPPDVPPPPVWGERDVVCAISAGNHNPSVHVDRHYTAGSTSTTDHGINTGKSPLAPQFVYQNERHGNFSYEIPNLMPGDHYTVRLHFSENHWEAANKRLFNVLINGHEVLNDFDIFSAAGGRHIAVTKQLPASADNGGKITIAFVSVADHATVSGIEVLAGSV